MYYFIFNLIVVSLFYVSLFLKNKTNREVLYYTIVIVVSILVGLRGNEDEYSSFYYQSPTLLDFSVYTTKEPLFLLVVSLLKTIGLGAQSVFIVFSSVAVFIHAVFYKRFTPYYFIAFIIYLSHEIAMKEMTGLRMGFASALILPMIYYLVNGDRLKFMVLAAISSMIHYVGTLSILLLFINREFKTKYYLIAIILAISFSQLNIVRQILEFSSGLLPAVANDYLKSSFHTYNAGLLSHYKTIQQLFLALFFLFLFKYKNNIYIKTSRYFNLIFNVYFMSTLFLIIFSEVAIFAFRFSAQFSIVEPLLITYMVFSFTEKKAVMILISIISLVVSYMNYIYLERLSPYSFFVT